LRSNLRERATRAGAWCELGQNGEARVGFTYLGRELRLSFPQGTVETRNGQAPVPLREEILVLHYLEKASGVPVAGEWASFSEIPGGTFYQSVFLMRCKAPLVKFFGEDPETLLAIAKDIGGEPLELGDVAVKIQAFPRVAVALVLWRGDAEFPAEGSILFDTTVNEYLPVEDRVILAETVVWKLIKAKGKEHRAKSIE
jgi:hypothetical protein